MTTGGYDTLETLRDGGSVRIRAIQPGDRQRLLDHFTLSASAPFTFVSSAPRSG